jgi:hypothetical protein
MEQNPSWEADGHSDGSRYSPPLWNSKVHYCVLKSLSLEPILSQFNPVHTLTTNFFQINFYIILPSTSRFHKLALISGFSTKLF